MAGWNPTAGPQVLPKVGGPAGNPAGAPAGAPSAAGVKSWAGKNRTTLLAAGAGGVVLLALVMKSRAAAAPADQSAAGSLTTGNPQNLAAYDSSSSDVYNALQPQLEAIQTLLNDWGTNRGAESTVPVAATPATSPTSPNAVTPTTSTVPIGVLVGTTDLGTQVVGTNASGYSTETVGKATYQTPAGMATVNVLGGGTVGGYNPNALSAINAAGKANAQNNIDQFLAKYPVATQSQADKNYLAKLYAQRASFG